MSDTLKKKKKEANLWGLEWFWLNWSWVTPVFISRDSDALLLILLLLYKEFSVSVFIQPTIFQETCNLDIFCCMWLCVCMCVAGGGVGGREVELFRRAFPCLVGCWLCAMLCDLVWFNLNDLMTFVTKIWKPPHFALSRICHLLSPFSYHPLCTRVPGCLCHRDYAAESQTHVERV